MYKVMAFCHLQKNFGDKYGKKLMDTATKVGTSKYSKKVQKQQEI